MLDVSLIMKIAGVGILVVVIDKVLKSAGKDDYAVITNLAGIIIILLMVVNLINKLFDTVKNFIYYLKEGIMEILKVVGFALTALFIVIIFQTKNRNDIAVPISLAAGILIFIFIIPKLTVIINFLQVLSNKANIDVSYLNLVFKILGIAYLASFCSEICKDAGAGSIGSKVEFAGKILILTLSIPILMAVLDSILKIL